MFLHQDFQIDVARVLQVQQNLKFNMFENYDPIEYGTHHSYVLVVHTLRVAENKILKLDLPAKGH
jgi:hypothetical protein